VMREEYLVFRKRKNSASDFSREWKEALF